VAHAATNQELPSSPSLAIDFSFEVNAAMAD
jgi:hypothetical protein